MKSNLYTLILDNWYETTFKDVKTVMRHYNIFNNLKAESSIFTRQFKTIQLNFGRQTGATYALAKFYVDHPDLNIKCYFATNELFKEFAYLVKKLSGKTISRSELEYKKGDSIFDIDIVFIDNYSYLLEEDFNVDLKYLLNILNITWNKNQWVIELG